MNLTEEQIDNLLEEVLDVDTSRSYWKNGEKMICCPVHGESNPSMGISAEKGICHCFSCGFAGDFAKLLMYSLPEKFGLDTETKDKERKTGIRAYRRASDFLSERYDLEVHDVDSKIFHVKRYEESRKLKEGATLEKESIPVFRLAPFMSGKETYQYFFDRGFTKTEMREFMIGRDLENETVTIPVFNEDKTLAGIIGRYISPNRKKNERYKIYNNFKRGGILYPLDKFEGDTAILVEGQFDAIRLYQYKYQNVLATLTNSVSQSQIKWLIENCEKVIYIGDSDKRGLEGRENFYEKMRGKISVRFTEFPDHGKDVCDWTEKEIAEVINSSYNPLIKGLRRK